ncbi:MAG: hypothetical protein WC873_02210 [Candidatus Gracilibacteria bacterium]
MNIHKIGDDSFAVRDVAAGSLHLVILARQNDQNILFNRQFLDQSGEISGLWLINLETVESDNLILAGLFGKSAEKSFATLFLWHGDHKITNISGTEGNTAARHMRISEITLTGMTCPFLTERLFAGTANFSLIQSVGDRFATVAKLHIQSLMDKIFIERNLKNLFWQLQRAGFLTGLFI